MPKKMHVTSAPPPEAEAIGEAMDVVMDRLDDSPGAFWPSESERLAIAYRNLERAAKVWQSSRNCVFHGCRAASIRKSHTIARSSSLARVAVDGHLYSPKFDPREERVRVLKIGIGNASTFPGFCQEHEQLFEQFEKAGQLDSMTDHILQTYRVICREFVAATLQVEKMRRSRSEIQAIMDAWGHQEILAELRRKGLSIDEAEKGAFHFRKQERLNRFDAVIKRRAGHLATLTRNFMKPFAKAIERGQKLPFTMVTHELEQVVPVALAGRIDFRYPFGKTKRPRKQIEAIVNVLPEASRTLLSMTVPAADDEAVRAYFSEFNFVRLATLNMIETWMIRGSDHWFLSPVIWEALPPERQRAVEDGVAHVGPDSTSVPKTSIFDDLRRLYLEEAQARPPAPAPDWYGRFLAQEELKLSAPGVVA